MEAKHQGTSHVDLDVLERQRLAANVYIGTLVEADFERGIRVLYSSLLDDEPVTARTTITVTPQDLGRQAVLVLENGDPDRPIIVGMLQAQPVNADKRPEAEGRVARDASRDIRVDGQRVHIEAQRELLLQCGKSSILLRADGQVYIKGMKIVSRARGTHKVKGANVLIN